MKILFNITLLLFSVVANAQQYEDPIANKLYKELHTENTIPHKYVGCYGGLSSAYQKVDSLRTLIGKENFIALCNDESYCLKYWAWVTLLQQNDSLAFIYLSRNLNDKTMVSFEYGHSEEYKFNELLIGLYSLVIDGKYKEGTSLSIHSTIFISHGKDKKKWKALNSDLNKLLEAHGIDKASIPNTCY